LWAWLHHFLASAPKIALNRLLGNELAPKHVLEFCPVELRYNALEFERERRAFENSDAGRNIGVDEEGA
jgi:hypothetical protein